MSSDQIWLAADQLSGENDTTILLTAGANSTTSERTAIVTVSATGVANPLQITVTQEAGATGINNSGENSLKLFPNPVTSQLVIHNLEKNAILSIFDLNGKLILSKKADSINEIIDVSNLVNGLYSVKIIENKKSLIYLFVKQ